MKRENSDNRLKEKQKNGLPPNSANSPFEDQQAILDLISNYSYTYDSKDINKFLSLFTSDCVWEVYMDRGTNLERHSGLPPFFYKPVIYQMSA